MIDEHKTYHGVGILITNLGTPEAPTAGAVRRYLKQFLMDKRVIEIPRLLWWPLLYGIILPFRSPKSAKLYQQIWQPEGSPLLVNTKRIAAELQTVLAKTNTPIHVEVAMRYGQPSIKKALVKLSAKKINKLLVLPLYPQYSATTVASTFDATSDVLRDWRYLPEFRIVNGYADDSNYITALAQSVTSHWNAKGRKAFLLMSYHGIPKRFFEKGDPYYCFCHKTSRLLAEALGLKETEWRMVFQSRFGREPWLQPYCDQVLTDLSQQGYTDVDIICPGFPSDCLETLQEIQIEYRSLFKRLGGGNLNYIYALNHNSQHIYALTNIIKNYLKGWICDDELLNIKVNT